MAKGKKMLALIGWLYPGAVLQKGSREEASARERAEGLRPAGRHHGDGDDDDDDDEFFGYAPV